MKFKSIFNLDLELAEDCGWNKHEVGGLFNKTALEGVRATHGRWISDERAGLKEKKEKKKIRERGRGRCLLPVGKQNTAASPWPAGRSSPEQVNKELRCMVFDSV